MHQGFKCQYSSERSASICSPLNSFGHINVIREPTFSEIAPSGSCINQLEGDPSLKQNSLPPHQRQNKLVILLLRIIYLFPTKLR